MVKIIKPTIGGHDGSSFRELLDLWVENGLCEIEMGPAERSKEYDEDLNAPESKCWVEEQGNVLLYDFPILDRLQHGYKTCLFSNMYKEGENNKKWVFWPKHSRIFDELKKDLRQQEKTNNCVFIGSPTNADRNSLAPYWLSICDVSHFGAGIPHPEYLRICASSTFGLCLPGVGPKCLRDVEYMGLGVIPIVVDENAMSLYSNPPVEGEHYFLVKDIEDLKLKMQNVSKKTIKDMSQSCIEWFEKNCSIKGSFETTMEIIENE